jgi:hypothetical protein
MANRLQIQCHLGIARASQKCCGRHGPPTAPPAGKGYLSRDVLPVAALRLDSRGGPIASRPDFHFDFLIEFLLVTALLSHSARWQVPGAGAHPASGALTVRLVTVGVN